MLNVLIASCCIVLGIAVFKAVGEEYLPDNAGFSPDDSSRGVAARNFQEHDCIKNATDEFKVYKSDERGWANAAVAYGTAAAAVIGAIRICNFTGTRLPDGGSKQGGRSSGSFASDRAWVIPAVLGLTSAAVVIIVTY